MFLSWRPTHPTGTYSTASSSPLPSNWMHDSSPKRNCSADLSCCRCNGWEAFRSIEHRSNRMVDQMIDKFNESNNFLLALAPEGTRHKAGSWKSGFYHIAVKARVPIQLMFLNYENKTGGAGPLIYPSGNLEKDMQMIRNFYSTVKGKHPDKTSPAVIFSKT